MLSCSRCIRRSLALRLAACACPLALTLPASATITVGGDAGEVSPADPATWTSTTTAYIGSTADKSGTLSLDGGSTITSSTGYLGYGVGSTGTATVTGAASTWTDGYYLHVGYFGAGALDIQNGGKVSCGSACYLGYELGATGTATVAGTGSTWAATGALLVGYRGTGTLNIQSGAQATSSGMFVGSQSGSAGVLSVSGTGSTLTTSSSFDVGSDGTGTLKIENGGKVISSYSNIGRNAGSIGAVTVSGAGSTWTNLYTLYVGGTGTGTLTVSDGGTVNTQTIYGVPAAIRGNGTINTHGLVADLDLIFDATHGSQRTLAFGSGGTLNLNLDGTGTFGVGNAGQGTMTIADGVTVHSGTGLIGYSSGSTGTVTVTGVGSTWTHANGPTLVGLSGTGTLNIQNGGKVVSDSGYIGKNTGSSGTVLVTGAGSTWANGTDLNVGGAGTGTLTVSDGGTVSTGTLYASPGSLKGNGTIAARGLVSDMNMVFDATHGLQQTIPFGSSGTLNLNLDGNWALGVGHIGQGTMRIVDGVTVRDATGYVGYNAGSAGAVTVSGAGSTWANSTDLYVGTAGTGTLSIVNGGTVNGAANGTIGRMAGSTGTVAVIGTGSTWTIGRDLKIGAAGNGTLNVSSGGQLISGLRYNAGWPTGRTSYIGYDSGAVGTVNVSGAGSTWTSDGELDVGYNGSGTLSITDGGKVSGPSISVGRAAGSGTVKVAGAGSTLANDSGTLYVGVTGNGTLTAESGGQIRSGGACIAGTYSFTASGVVGKVTVTGPGSSWRNGYDIALGAAANIGTLNIANGGQVTSSSLSIGNALSCLNLHVAGDNLLVLGNATTPGTLANNGRVNLYADSSLASGTYKPISDLSSRTMTWSGSGSYNAFGGLWDNTAKTFTVAAPTLVEAGISDTLTTGERLTITDATGTRHIGVSFGTVPDGSTFSATPMAADQLSSLTLAPGQSVASAWDFTTNLAGSTVLLSFDVGPGASNLQVWHYSDGVWTPLSTDVTYANGIASFTVSSFSGYAVTAAIPEPTTLSVFALAGLTLLRRRQPRRPSSLFPKESW